MRLPDVPRAPGGLPVLGHALPFIRDPLRFMSSLPAVGDLVELRLGPMTMYMACDPDLTWQVLTNDKVFDKGGLLFTRLREVGGNGLITCAHRDHRRQRRLIQPAFQAQKIKGYAAAIAAQTEGVIAGWHDGQVVDVPADMLVLTSNAVVETIFSSSLTPRLRTQYAHDLTVLMSSILWRTLAPWPLTALPTPGNRRSERALRRLRANLAEVIEGRRREQIGTGDLLASLLSARDPESGDGARASRFSDDEIGDQLVTFFVAGSETTANTLAWALYLLARHPDVQEQVQRDVDAVLGGRPPTVEDVPRLDLVGRVLLETLRMYPTGPLFFTREVTAEARLGAHVLPAGTTVAYSPYLTHRRPDLYPDPDRFDLDRTYPRRAYIPFAVGARKCIGDNFAMTETTLALAAILARWTVEPLSDAEVRPAFAISLRPHRLRLRVTARAPAATAATTAALQGPNA
ncbi:cytochrome P450 [Actinomycetes bacterium KLBMP 9759]